MFLVLALVLTIVINASDINVSTGASDIDGSKNASDILESLDESDALEPVDEGDDGVTYVSGINELCSYMRKVNAGIQHTRNFCMASDACDGLSKFFLDILEQLSRKAIEYRCG